MSIAAAIDDETWPEGLSPAAFATLTEITPKPYAIVCSEAGAIVDITALEFRCRSSRRLSRAPRPHKAAAPR